MSIYRQSGKAQDLITFTRGSGGTALRKVTYGVNLVTNGDFSTGDFTGWTITGTDATHTITLENGGARYQSDTTTPVLYLTQQNLVNTSKLYQITVVISDYVSGSLKIDTTSGPVFFGGNGTFVYNISPSSVNVGLYRATTNVDMIVQSLSVKEVLFDRADGNLVLFNHPANVPRLEYDSQGNALGLLVEESRTNLVTYSEDFTDSSWRNVASTRTADQAEAPNKTETADSFVPDATSTWHGFDLAIAGVSVTSGTTYTYSIYAKANGYNWLQIGSSTPAFTGTYANVNLSDGSTGNSSGVTTTVTDVGNDWYRISVTATAVANSSNGSFFVAVYNSDVGSRLPAFSGNGASGIYIWGAQVEQGAFPTSYIPTSGSAVTRSADSATIAMSSFGYNKNRSTFVAQATELGGLDDSSTQRHTLFSTETASSLRLNVGKNTGGGGSGDEMYVGEVASGTYFYVGDINKDSSYKVAVVVETNNISAILDGGTIASDSTVALAKDETLLSIGRRAYNGTNQFNGHIKSLDYYPRRLTNAQLMALTEPSGAATINFTFDGQATSTLIEGIHD